MASLSRLLVNEQGNRPMNQRTLVSNGNPMEEIVGFSRAVRVGPYIAVGGTAPVDTDGETVGIGDVAAHA